MTRTTLLLGMAMCTSAACDRPSKPAPAVELGEIGRASAADEPPKADEPPAEEPPADTPPLRADAGSPTAPSVNPFTAAKIENACNEAMSLRSAVEMYMVSEGGKCPADIATLATRRFIAKAGDDPWGHPYRLQCPEIEIRSGGPDGKLDTPDDVVLGETGETCEGA
jgi:hypothetical protein